MPEPASTATLAIAVRLNRRSRTCAPVGCSEAALREQQKCDATDPYGGDTLVEQGDRAEQDAVIETGDRMRGKNGVDHQQDGKGGKKPLRHG